MKNYTETEKIIYDDIGTVIKLVRFIDSVKHVIGYRIIMTRYCGYSVDKKAILLDEYAAENNTGIRDELLAELLPDVVASYDKETSMITILIGSNGREKILVKAPNINNVNVELVPVIESETNSVKIIKGISLNIVSN